MKKITDKIIDLMLKQGYINTSQMGILSYGMALGFELLIGLICVCFILVLTQQFLFLVTFLIAFSALRFYSGGLHLEDFRACLVLSNLVLLFVVYNKFNIQYLFEISGVWLLFVVIYFLPPKDSIKRKLSFQEKKKFFWRRNIILLIFLSLMMIFPKSDIALAILWAILVNACSLLLGHLKGKFI